MLTHGAHEACMSWRWSWPMTHGLPANEAWFGPVEMVTHTSGVGRYSALSTSCTRLESCGSAYWGGVRNSFARLAIQYLDEQAVPPVHSVTSHMVVVWLYDDTCMFGRTRCLSTNTTTATLLSGSVQ